MPARQPQVIDAQEFIPICDYHFTGDDDTVSKKRLFIENLREHAAVYIAAAASGFSKKTAYRWRAIDQEFADAWDEAEDDCKETMVSSVYRRGLNGDSLLSMFWLKAHDSKYRDKVAVDIRLVESELEERMQQMTQARQLPQLLPAPVIDRNGNGHSPSIDSSSITANSPPVQATQKTDPVTVPSTTSDDQSQS